MENITCGLTRGELDRHSTWITAEGICIALKPNKTKCNCAYSAHLSNPVPGNNYHIESSFNALRISLSFCRLMGLDFLLSTSSRFEHWTSFITHPPDFRKSESGFYRLAIPIESAFSLGNSLVAVKLKNHSRLSGASQPAPISKIQ